MSDVNKNIFSIPWEEIHDKGGLHPSDRRSLLSEEMRLIKRRLFRKMSLANLYSKGDEEEDEDNHKMRNVILVTSSKPAEGKTFTSLNLSLSIALDEKYNVLLIDADIIRASLSRRMGVYNSAGLTDLLRHKKPYIPDYIMKSDEYPLSFIPAGSGVATATDLFGGKKMHYFVKHIANRYKDRIIIFDAPPLLASTEAVVLAQQVGQVVYVVNGSETPRSTVEAGLDVLGKTDNLSFILNKVTTHSDIAQFGTYYDYYKTENPED